MAERNIWFVVLVIVSVTAADVSVIVAGVSVIVSVIPVGEVVALAAQELEVYLSGMCRGVSA